MSSGRAILDPLENSEEDEMLQFNPANGKLEIVSRRAARQQQSQNSGVDQKNSRRSQVLQPTVSSRTDYLENPRSDDRLVFDPATGKLKIVSGQRTDYLENPRSNDRLVSNPATGKLKRPVQLESPRSDTDFKRVEHYCSVI